MYCGSPPPIDYDAKMRDDVGAKDAEAIIPDVYDGPKNLPTMLTTDLSPRFDPIEEPISCQFKDTLGSVRGRVRVRLAQADSPRHGPRRAAPRLGGPDQGAIWQDPLPAVGLYTDAAGCCKGEREGSSSRI
jgi:catalase (peroxidase I)